MLLATLLLTLSPHAAVQDDAAREASDLAAARAVFEANVAAIQARDRDAYLACYAPTPRLVRVGPDGFQTGFEELAASTAATGSDDWPQRLDAYDLRLAWLRPGAVYGTYRYSVVFEPGDAPARGLSGRLFLAGDDGWRIHVTSAFPAGARPAAPPLALVGATLHDGDGGPPLADAVVLLRDGRVEAVGKRGELEPPADATLLDLAGRHLTPGLVDAHVHYSQTGWADGRPDATDVRATYPYAATIEANRAHPERFHRAFLDAGVTAVFDVGGFPWTRALSEAAEDDPDAPHVVAAGPLLVTWLPEVLNLPDQQQMVRMEDAEQVRAVVASHAASGSDAIKVWFVQAGGRDFAEMVELTHAAGEAARAHGLPLIVHATELESARVALEAGAAVLVHSVEDREVDDAFLELARNAGVVYCPTLTVRDGYAQLYARELSDEVRGQLDAVDPTVAARARATEELPRDPRFSESAVRAMRERFARQRETMYANLRRVHAAGIPVAMGTDAGNPLTLHGPSVFPELEALEAAGLSPADVLVAATRDAARALGRADELGRVAPGYVADLVVLAEDPSASAAAWRSRALVLRAGHVHRP